MNEGAFTDFNFGGPSGKESGSTDSPARTLQDSPLGPASAEATAHLERVREGKRGRPRKDDATREAERAKIREELTREMAQLFSPEYWEGIVRGPADLMLHISKREIWDVPEKEFKPLAVGAANTARLFLQADPKWIALFMFSVSLTQIYGVRAALHMAQVRKEAKEGREKKDQAKEALKVIEK